MKVRCIKLFNHQGQEVTSHSFISLHQVYDVIYIYLAPAPALKIFNAGKPVEGTFPLKYFELVDGTIPKNWIISVTNPDIMKIGPKPFIEYGFWNKFYNTKDEEAQKIYREELEKMGITHLTDA